jgi:hypothetical protein
LCWLNKKNHKCFKLIFRKSDRPFWRVELKQEQCFRFTRKWSGRNSLGIFFISRIEKFSSNFGPRRGLVQETNPRKVRIFAYVHARLGQQETRRRIGPKFQVVGGCDFKCEVVGEIHFQLKVATNHSRDKTFSEKQDVHKL